MYSKTNSVGRTSPKGPTGLCYLCKVAARESYGYCRPCHALYKRVIHRTKYGSVSKVWHKIDCAKRNAFISSCKGKNGAELKGAVNEFVTKEIPSMLTTVAGLWMDSPDLQSKYNDKPEQWKALREHMYTFVRLVICFEAVEKGDMQKHVKAAKAVSPDESEPKA